MRAPGENATARAAGGEAMELAIEAWRERRRTGPPLRSCVCGVCSLLLLAPPARPASEHAIFPGDGSDEPGFVPPPAQAQLPPPPARTVASAETFIPYPPPPVAPMARSEAKKPPRPPVLFTKLRTEHLRDWAATPNDINNLLRRMKETIGVDYAMEVKSLDEVDPDPEKNPILFRSGHYHFEFSPQQRERLRTLLLAGGMLVLNTGLGSKPFYDSAVKELALIFPERHLQRMSPDHPLFHAYYDLDRIRYRPGVYKTGYRGDEPWFEGVSINCRTVAVVSRWGMAVGWEEDEEDSYQAYVSEDAQRLGVNIFAYATAQRAWVRQTAQAMTFVDREPFASDKLSLAQLIYDGEWKTRHAGLSVLLRTFNLKTDVPVKFALRELRLSDPGLFDAPALYLTGHEYFQLPPAELERLRRYLLSGGFLFAEACCGRRGFDLALRTQLGRILPEHPLRAVAPSDVLLRLPNNISQLNVTPALAAQLGRAATAPALEVVEIDGHYAVVYSPFGLAGGWEMSPCPYAYGYDERGSLLLGQNILMYAVTQ